MNTTVAVPSLTDVESLRLAARLIELAQAMAATEEIADFHTSGWLPDRFFDLLGELYRCYDSYIEHNIAASGLRVQCRFGCSRCCMQAVHGVYSFEIINLYRHLRALPEYGEIHDRCVDRADEFQRLVVQYLAAHRIDAAQDNGAAISYALQAVAAPATKACPLLSDNRCSVYAHRPVPCRMYHSLTNPIYCMTARGENFHLEPPEQANAILWQISSRLAFPFCEFLAQGLVSFALRRQFRPWAAPQATPT